MTRDFSMFQLQSLMFQIMTYFQLPHPVPSEAHSKSQAFRAFQLNLLLASVALHNARRRLRRSFDALQRQGRQARAERSSLWYLT